MMQVWKHSLVSGNGVLTSLMIPRGSKPLAVQMQNGGVHLWSLCDPAQPATTIDIVCVGTGEPFGAKHLTYIGTVQDDDGYVWHYFYAGG